MVNAVDTEKGESLLDRAWTAFSNLVMPSDSRPDPVTQNARPVNTEAKRSAPVEVDDDYNITNVTLTKTSHAQATGTAPSQQANRATTVSVEMTDGGMVAKASDGLNQSTFKLETEKPGISLKLLEGIISVAPHATILPHLKDPLGFVAAAGQQVLFHPEGDGIADAGKVFNLNETFQTMLAEQKAFQKAMSGAKDAALQSSLKGAIGAGISSSTEVAQTAALEIATNGQAAGVGKSGSQSIG